MIEPFSQSKSKTRSIFVFKVNQLGDAVAFLPTLQRLFESAKKRSIPLHLWTTPIASSVLNIDPSIRLHQTPLQQFNGAWKHPGKCLQVLREVRSARPAACLLDWDQGNLAHLAAFLSGAKTIVGGTNRKVIFKSLPHEVVAQNLQQPVPFWSWEIARQFARSLFDEEWEPTPPTPNLDHLLPSANNSHIASQPKPILIHPGASTILKRWPLERFITLAIELARTHPVILIQPRELPKFDAPSHIRVISPTSISELVNAISNSSLFIGNNSGPMNFAFALGVPSVIFWGPSDPAWRAAWQEEKHLSLARRELPCLACEITHYDNQCHNHQEKIACMNRWSVEEVLARCQEWHRKWNSDHV